MIALAAEFLRISYLLFFYKVLEDLQETLEVEIQGAVLKTETVTEDVDKNNTNDKGR